MQLGLLSDFGDGVSLVESQQPNNCASRFEKYFKPVQKEEGNESGPLTNDILRVVRR